MKNVNVSLGIKRLPFTRMLKSEVADYAENTINIIEKHDPESAIVSPVMNLMLGKKGAIELLRLSYGIDIERLRANKLKADLMLHISAFKLGVRLLNRSNVALDLHVIQNAINNHLTYLNKCKNDKELNQKVGGFFDLVKTDIDLQSALADFNLHENVTQMSGAYHQVNEVWQKRVELLSQRPAINTRAIVRSIADATNNLFKGVELAHIISTVSVANGGDQGEETTDFVPLIEELNQLSEMYYKSITIRDANNKRKALEEEQKRKEEEEENEASASSYCMYMDDAYDEDDNWDDELNVSPTDATSDKEMLAEDEDEDVESVEEY